MNPKHHYQLFIKGLILNFNQYKGHKVQQITHHNQIMY